MMYKTRSNIQDVTERYRYTDNGEHMQKYPLLWIKREEV